MTKKEITAMGEAVMAAAGNKESQDKDLGDHCLNLVPPTTPFFWFGEHCTKNTMLGCVFSVLFSLVLGVRITSSKGRKLQP